EEQLLRMQKYVRIISPDIHVIESAGGGSARCMMAELF
ncbi:MAG: amidinotransferase, partial [Phocaeicola sp.]|nr:amidinotransferase [Phocaeicola sp.]